LEKPEPPSATKKRLRTSTKLFLFEIICFLIAMLLWHVYVYFDEENGLVLYTIYFLLLIACFFIGAAMLIAVLGERKQLWALGIPRLIGFLIAALILPNIHLRQTDAWRVNRWELRKRENTVKKLGEVFIEYAKAHGGNLPSSNNWCDELDSFEPALTSGSFDAKHRSEPHCTVAFNKNISGANLQSLSSNTVLVFESEGPWNLSGGSELLYAQSKDNEFAYLFLVDGKTYKYYFSQEQAKDMSNNSYVSIQWKP